jgi:hypothetical protein
MTRRTYSLLVCGAALAALATGLLWPGTPQVAQAGPDNNKLSTPVLKCGDSNENSISLKFCAGSTGASAGFSIQWMTCAEYEENKGWYASDDPRLCKASFSANAKKGDPWNVPSNTCIDIPIGGLQELADTPSLGVSTNCGGPLDCDECYVFRAFAHNVPGKGGLNKSDFSDNIDCSTLDCGGGGGGCTLSKGYWSNKGCDDEDTQAVVIPTPCGNINACGVLVPLTQFAGPGIPNARGRLAQQIAALYLSPITRPEKNALLTAAITAFCNSQATVQSLSVWTAALSAYIDANHCTD